MGGPVAAGTRYAVGEIGPELFVPNVGQPSMIGVGGQETRSFPTSGMVIPNHLVDAFTGVESGMRAHAEAVAAQGQARGRVRGGGGNVYHGDTVTLNVHGSDGMSARDLMDEAARMLDRRERDRAERR